MIKGWRGWRRWAGLSAAVLLLVAAAWGWRARRTPPALAVDGDSLPIRLVGVRPDGGDELLNAANGQRIGEWPDDAEPFTEWSASDLRTDFIFALPETDQPIQFVAPIFRVSGSEREAPASVRVGGEAIVRGERRHVLSALLVELSPMRVAGFPLGSRRPPERVDVVLRYYAGPRGAPDAVFEGPFEPGKAASSPQLRGGALIVRPMEEGGGTKLEVRGTSGQTTPLIVYDRSGGWRLAESFGFVTRQNILWYDYGVHGVRPEQIARVTVNEAPRERIFRNVLVDHPGRKPRTYPPYLDQMAQRLGRGEPTSLRMRRYASGAEAASVIDVARGWALRQAWDNMRYPGGKSARPSAYGSTELERVRAAARRCLEGSDEQMRGIGVQMGLWGGWDEFVEPAFGLVEAQGRGRDQAAIAISQVEKLDDGHLNRIAAILLRGDDPLVFDALYGRLANSSRPAAMDGLVRLAADERPWVWWRAVEVLSGRGEAHLRRLMAERPETRWKVVLLRSAEWAKADAAQEAEANARLRTLLTPRFVSWNLAAFASAMRVATDRLGKEAGTEALVTLLQNLAVEWNEHRFPGRSDSKWWAVDRAVRQLNAWHGVNIGDLGRDLEHETALEYALDWRAVAEDALRWRKTGADPALLPAGWRPASEDVRIIWRNVRKPEQSAIVVWSQRDPQIRSGRPVVLRSEKAFLIVRPAAERPGDAVSGYDLALNFGVFRNWSNGMRIRVSRELLPQHVELKETRQDAGPADWEAARAADFGEWEVHAEGMESNESVLAGTGLLREWKAKYLAKRGDRLPRIHWRDEGAIQGK